MDELAFGQFRLDRANALLWRGEERISLAPKPFALLCRLVARPGELVTKDELLDTVWADLHVSDASLTVAMNALRAALGDDRQSPSYIETVTRRGYRFIASVVPSPSSALVQREAEAQASDDAVDPRRHWRVGRAVPLQMLDSILHHVGSGQRQVVFITGEAGIGKTTLVQMALDRVKRDGVGVLHCACNELFGTHEAFLPLIEALNEQCRGPDGVSLLKAIRDHAATWLVQMPNLLGEGERSAFQQEVFGATRERMLREFSELMESLAARRPWVLVLEDLHWSDFATVDVLSRLARRERKAAILVLATYRPADVMAGGHPIRTLHQDLQIHGQCTELALDRLSSAEVERYLALRFRSRELAGELAERVFGRTGGQPLFVTSLLDHLVAQGTLVEDSGQWRLQRDAAASHDSMPRDLQGMIARQIDHLTAEERSLLEVASAAGAEFSAVHVAHALALDVLDVEALYEDLARAGRVIVAAGITEWPNGEVSGRYAFQHALYQEILYQRLAPARRVKTHAGLGASLEEGYGSQATEVASVLAHHFELGRDFAKALRYLTMAAESSSRRFSPPEAANYLSRALELVSHLSDDMQVKTRLKLLLLRAWAWRAGGNFVRSIEDLRSIIAHAAGNGLLREEVNAMVDLSRFVLYLDPRQSVPLAEQALSKSLAIDDPAFRALVRGNAANLRIMLKGWTAEDAAFARQAAELIGDSEDLSMRLRRCSIEVVLEIASANYPACCAAARRGKAVIRLIGDVYIFVIFTMAEAFALLYSGEWGGTQDVVNSALEISMRNANPQATAICKLTLGWLYAEAQEFDRAVRMAEETLNAAIESNPTSFYIGRNLLARAYIALGNLPLARQHLAAVEQRLEVDGVPMETSVFPPYLLNRCNYFIATEDMEQAHSAALRFHEFVTAAPDLPFLALSYEVMARLAMRQGDTPSARRHLREAVSVLRRARLPHAAGRVYGSAAAFYESLGEIGRAAKWRQRARREISLLANSLPPEDPLRSAPLLRVDVRSRPADLVGSASVNSVR
ncbi:conserved hypothetical protein [Bradyrhizobium sp. STM 3843]|uniref:AAA family ATPase n=1 Tax=Bradyrhizobium sp. STM 3843 TaxID=551947 RepID=UPI0002403D41|nr:AAA family ATPase [Bradyrhizobium sp. STM 3843]CCE10327.1 conserved hypothetical protein [Bradyrhizobium sp. STM 3843]